MIDLANLGQYRENNRIEAKRALGGLPESIWETYSAFANTLGGIILLGVEEHPDHTLHAIDLPDPARLVREFWRKVNDPHKASVNILSVRDVRIETVQAGRIIVITVPRASRFDRPVYIDGAATTGTYRRSGEGDYRCTLEQVHEMLRQSRVHTRDMRLVAQLEPSCLNTASVRSYRARMELQRPGHSWQTLTDFEFLCRCGALDADREGKLHPTAAGLLMFGNSREILSEFPHYRLEYQDLTGARPGRVCSSDRAWSGNLYDFYFTVCHLLARGLTTGPGGEAMAQALREALANCLVNADYEGSQELLIRKYADCITLTNPGSFCIDVESAKSGGVADPRNAALVRLFNRILVGGGTGSGIPRIYSAWKNRGWSLPVIAQSARPERTTLTLPVGSGARAEAVPPSVNLALVIDDLTEHAGASLAEIAARVALAPDEAQRCLRHLMEADIVVFDGALYRLKA